MVALGKLVVTGGVEGFHGWLADNVVWATGYLLQVICGRKVDLIGKGQLLSG